MLWFDPDRRSHGVSCLFENANQDVHLFLLDLRLYWGNGARMFDTGDHSDYIEYLLDMVEA